MKKVLICIPTYAGSIKWQTFLSFTAMDRSGLNAQLMGIERVIIDRARNVAADAAVNGGYDYLLFIDDDMTFAPDALHRLIERDGDIVAGLFFGRVEPSMHLMFSLVDTEEGAKYEKYDIDGLLEAEKNGACVEVDGIGTGFTLIKTEVLRKLKEDEAPLFATVNRGEKKFMSEDLYFCKRSQEAGFKIWCDTSVKIGHIGEKVWSWDDFSPRAQEFKAALQEEKKNA